MEDLLDLYAEPFDPIRPVVCLDEQPYQLLADRVAPLPATPGRDKRQDYTYQRQGTCNFFLMFQPLAGWRQVTITEQRTRWDYAACLKDLAEVYSPATERIRLVQDNLNTHTPAALYETFAPAEARRLVQKFEVHYTPKHASWLNMAELEFAVLNGQCTDRRLPNFLTLRREVECWQQQRNQTKATVQWQFTTRKARETMKRAYPV